MIVCVDIELVFKAWKKYTRTKLELLRIIQTLSRVCATQHRVHQMKNKRNQSNNIKREAYYFFFLQRLQQIKYIYLEHQILDNIITNRQFRHSGSALVDFKQVSKWVTTRCAWLHYKNDIMWQTDEIREQILFIRCKIL